MAYNAQNGGVYILINGDASPLQRTLENLKKNVSSTAKQIEAEMQGIMWIPCPTRKSSSAWGRGPWCTT